MGHLNIFPSYTPQEISRGTKDCQGVVFVPPDILEEYGGTSAAEGLGHTRLSDTVERGPIKIHIW